MCGNLAFGLVIGQVCLPANVHSRGEGVNEDQNSSQERGIHQRIEGSPDYRQIVLKLRHTVSVIDHRCDGFHSPGSHSRPKHRPSSHRKESHFFTANATAKYYG
jgi:hypothetical protein